MTLSERKELDVFKVRRRDLSRQKPLSIKGFMQNLKTFGAVINFIHGGKTFYMMYWCCNKLLQHQ